MSDADNANGYITLQHETEANFWLYALCERHKNAGYCSKETTNNGTKFTFRSGEIKELHAGIDKHIRMKDTVKFPSEDFMRKYTNTTAKSKSCAYLFSEIADVLTFLAPIRNLIQYIYESKALSIKFTEKESE